MAIGEYLKAAAAQLRRAAQAARTEGDDLRRKVSEAEREMTKTVDQLKQTIRQRHVDIKKLQTQNNPAFTATETTLVVSLEQEIKKIQQGFERERQQILQEIQHRENQVNELNGKASDFEQQAATA